MPVPLALRPPPAIVKRRARVLNLALESPPGKAAALCRDRADLIHIPPSIGSDRAHERGRPRRVPKGMPMILRDIAAALSAPVEGDGSIDIAGIADPAHASGSDLALAMTRESVPALAHSKARAVVVAAKVAAAVERFDAGIKVEHPRHALAVLTGLFERPIHRGTGIHPSAVVAPDARIDEGASIGPLSVIGPRARIGAGTVALAHATVGAPSALGRDCLFHPGVRIGDRVVIEIGRAPCRGRGEICAVG